MLTENQCDWFFQGNLLVFLFVASLIADYWGVSAFLWRPWFNKFKNKFISNKKQSEGRYLSLKGVVTKDTNKRPSNRALLPKCQSRISLAVLLEPS